jgi:Ca-activated chloride channel family protein
MRTHEGPGAMRYRSSRGAPGRPRPGGRGMRFALAACAVLATATAAPATAQGWIDPLPRARDWGVVKVRSSVRVRVTGRVAEVEVEEWFENRGGGLGEGDYLYPLPGEAVFSSFSLFQGDRELRGETMNADQARSIYEEIVRRKRDPALIELVGHGLIRGRVFPIEPGQRRKITLRYTQVLERAGDAVQFRYAAGSRFAGRPARPVPDRPGPVPITPGSGIRERVPIDFTLIADAGAYRDPFSPTHELDVERRRGELRVRPVGDLFGDLSVLLPVAGERIGLALVAHRPAGEDGYFMLTLSPGPAGRGTTPRDITAVVDVSGSMSGQKLEQTREALHQLLGSLGPDDRFRLVAFSNRVRISGDSWSRARGDGLRAARRWIDDLVADGGTNIAGALEEAFRLESPEERLPIVVFLTDGLPTVGERDPERIAEAAERSGSRARVFAFGVGYDVNTYLLDRLSAAGRGSTEYVEPGEDVEVALGALAGKITHPVLTDLEIAGAPVRLEEVYPVALPDLFAGEDLVVFGRYDGDDDGALRIRGRRAGRVENFAVAARFPGHAEANDFIPRLWASRKLGELTRQVRLHGPDDELIDAIRSTALRYGLLSEYTSYLVQEPEMFARDDVRLQPMTVTAARAPADQASGAAAVKASERARVRREVASAADLDVAEEAVMAEVANGAGGAVRVVAGRSFRLQADVWVEIGPDPDDRSVVEVELYSAAYFALVRALPELEPVLSELEPVQVRGRQVTLRFSSEGATTLSAREIDRLVARFRDR